jgi:hypothetical protein
MNNTKAKLVSFIACACLCLGNSLAVPTWACPIFVDRGVEMTDAERNDLGLLWTSAVQRSQDIQFVFSKIGNIDALPRLAARKIRAPYVGDSVDVPGFGKGYIYFFQNAQDRGTSGLSQTEQIMVLETVQLQADALLTAYRAYKVWSSKSPLTTSAGGATAELSSPIETKRQALVALAGDNAVVEMEYNWRYQQANFKPTKPRMAQKSSPPKPGKG